MAPDAGTYFAGQAPPTLFVQGSADTINPPWTSVQLYRADRASPRYYLDLYGADHMIPYTGDNPVERLVARVTLAFFARYVLGRAGALATTAQAASPSGIAALDSGGQLPRARARKGRARACRAGREPPRRVRGPWSRLARRRRPGCGGGTAARHRTAGSAGRRG